MPKGTVVAKVEANLMQGARKKHMTGERRDRYVYGTLNKLGLKKGNKTTAKGMQKVHKTVMR